MVTAGLKGRDQPRGAPLPLSTKRDATSRRNSFSLCKASRRMLSALSQKSSLASSATAVNAGVVRTKNRKSRLGTPSASAACAIFPHVSANTCCASSMEIFSQLGGTLVAGYRGISLTLSPPQVRSGYALRSAVAPQPRIDARTQRAGRDVPLSFQDGVRLDRRGTASL